MPSGEYCNIDVRVTTGGNSGVPQWTMLPSYGTGGSDSSRVGSMFGDITVPVTFTPTPPNPMGMSEFIRLMQEMHCTPQPLPAPRQITQPTRPKNKKWSESADAGVCFVKASELVNDWLDPDFHPLPDFSELAIDVAILFWESSQIVLFGEPFMLIVVNDLSQNSDHMPQTKAHLCKKKH